MKRAACTVLFLAANGLNLVAVEPDEPLAGVKQELKQLQTDTTAQKNGNVDPKLKSALPSVVLQPQPATTGAEQAGSKRQSEKDLKKQKDAQKNWLLREYEKLDEKPDQARSADKDKMPGAPTEEKSEYEQLQDRLSANDPKSRDGKDESMRGKRMEAPGAPDPFAPFMKDWLANSPVSGPAYDSLTKPVGNQSSPLLVPGYESRPAEITSFTGRLPDSSTVTPRRDRDGFSTPTPNPFLSGLELPGQPETTPAAPVSGPVADTWAPVMIPPVKSSLMPQIEPAEAGKRNSVAPPASKLAEDKKYFPQQKRF